MSSKMHYMIVSINESDDPRHPKNNNAYKAYKWFHGNYGPSFNFFYYDYKKHYNEQQSLIIVKEVMEMKTNSPRCDKQIIVENVKYLNDFYNVNMNIDEITSDNYIPQWGFISMRSFTFTPLLETFLDNLNLRNVIEIAIIIFYDPNIKVLSKLSLNSIVFPDTSLDELYTLIKLNDYAIA